MVKLKTITFGMVDYALYHHLSNKGIDEKHIPAASKDKSYQDKSGTWYLVKDDGTEIASVSIGGVVNISCDAYSLLFNNQITDENVFNRTINREIYNENN
jgi:hypothetical protein